MPTGLQCAESAASNHAKGLHQAWLIIAAVVRFPHADAAVSLTSLTANTWPFAFLTLRSFLRKYLHRYTTTFGLFCSCAFC
jgi:hypothetical protein